LTFKEIKFKSKNENILEEECKENINVKTKDKDEESFVELIIESCR